MGCAVGGLVGDLVGDDIGARVGGDEGGAVTAACRIEYSRSYDVRIRGVGCTHINKSGKDNWNQGK